jgi:rRNA maturation endonuclease Nob1
MSAIIITVLTLVAFGFAFYPLFREERWAFATERAVNPHLENLLSAREATYGAIKDLESDHAQGKLSDADYQALRAKYESKALLILQELNLVELRASTHAQHKSPSRVCARCGEAYSAADKFCRRCGAQLGMPACENCGTAIQPEWKFCKQCGAPIGAQSGVSLGVCGD